jgi:amidase
VRFDEYAQLDGIELARRIKAGEVSVGEITQAALDGIEATNPRLNAVTTRLDEHAEAALRTERPHGNGALAGVPTLLKETLPLEGTVITWSSSICREFVSPRTHEVADRMSAAGMPFLGRTNMSELGLTPTTEPALFGPTHNPWNTAYSPGGSSGGAAAAVAAGMVPFAHAADGGGSIRIPASACGIFGLKVSRGRLPNSPFYDPEGFVVEGCVSRTVRDSAAFLDATHGPEPGGKFFIDAPAGSYLEAVERDPEPLRIAVSLTDGFGEDAAPSVVARIEKMAERLEALGHRIEEAQPRVNGERFFAAFLVLWRMCAGYFVKAIRRGILERDDVPKAVKSMAKTKAGFEAMLWADGRATGRPAIDWFLRRLAREDAHQTASDVWMAWQDLHEITLVLTRHLSDFDVWLTPVLAEPVWKTGTLRAEMPREELEAKLTRYVGFMPFINTSGLPSMSVPAGFDLAGLPVGAHIVAPMGREDRLLQLAAQLERAYPWNVNLPVRLP